MYIVQGDHGIPIPFTVQKLSASENIEGATVEVTIHRGVDTFTKAATILNATKGECEFVLTSNDLTLFAKYEWQWTAYFPDGRIFSGKKREFLVSERLIAGSAGGETVPVIVPFATVEELEALRTEFEQGSGGTGGSVLVFQTLADLQAAYPNGINQPAWVVAENDWYYWSGEIISDTTAPVLTITAGGTFTGTKSVTMSVNETADIYYTLDGSTPTASSTKYTSPLSISATTTLRAFAKDTAGNSSAIQTVTYTLDATPPADTTAPDNVTNLAYSSLAQTSLTLTWTASASSDVASYDVYNEATLLANVTGTTYNVSGLTASTQYTFTVKAKDAANNVASGTSATVTTSAPADTTAPTVTASPAAGTYTTVQSVTLTANETATIYYTTNGNTPTEASSVYSAPISISATTTLKYFAKDTAGNSSAVQSATYTINLAFVEGPNALSMNGTSDYIEYTGFSYDTIELTLNLNSTSAGYLIDTRTNASAYLMSGAMGGFSEAYINGVADTVDSAFFSRIPKNVKSTIKLKLSTASGTTATGTFFSRGATFYNQWSKGSVYSIKLYKTGTLLAHWDFTNQTGNTTITDQTGNNHVLTRTTGTWITG